MTYFPRTPVWLGLVTVLAAATGGPRALAQTNVTKALTIHECIERAMANNLDIQIERINPTIQSWGVVREQGAFEPSLAGQATYSDATTPLDPVQATALGLGTLDNQTLHFSTGLIGKLPTGTQYNLNAFDDRSSGTLSSNFVFTGTAGISLTQPLLRNFGLDPNTANLRIARKNKTIAAEQFELQAINTISDVQNAYYELVFAVENHKATIEDLNRAKALLADTRKRVEVGVMSPLDVTQAEAGVAEREVAVITSERAIRDGENALKRLISQDVSEFRGMALLPVDYPLVEMVETDVAGSTRTALEMRPDFLRAKQELEKQGIVVKFNRNQLWPQVDLQGSYGLNGRGGTFGSLADNVGTTENPQWAVGVVLTIPLGNRVARANYQTALLQEQQAVINLKRLEQNIVVGVDNIVGAVQTNLKRVDATHVASRLARESLKAEETKLRAGTSTSFLVLQAQSDLAAALSAEIRARADYSRSLVELAREEGTTLRKHNIVLDEKF